MSLLADAVDLVIPFIEGAGAIIIAAGAVWAFGHVVVLAGRRSFRDSFMSTRLSLGRALVLGLEFQLAADLLRTAVAPGFSEIGQLAAIAAIRTALTLFLRQELRSEGAA